MKSEVKVVTVRLPTALYERFSRNAKKRKVSLNAYVQQSLSDTLRLEEDQALYEAFGRFGENKTATDVDYASAAQQEALERNESSKTR